MQGWVKIVAGHSHTVLAACDVTLIASGTATTPQALAAAVLGWLDAYRTDPERIVQLQQRFTATENYTYPDLPTASRCRFCRYGNSCLRVFHADSECPASICAGAGWRLCGIAPLLRCSGWGCPVILLHVPRPAASSFTYAK